MGLSKLMKTEYAHYFRRLLLVVSLGVVFVIMNNCAAHAQKGWERPDMDWDVHSMDRPQPEVITPATLSTQKEAGEAPSDAIVLFDGSNLSKWQSVGGGPAEWKVTDGYMEVVDETGNIETRQSFGDVQLHVEWAAPAQVEGNGQGRGNSGVFLMKNYEVQVLDCYQNETYADGMTASLYGQYPPQVNACRPPGEWQTYDIIFRRPHFDEDGNVMKPATVTVIHNGVLVQDHVELTGPTGHKSRPPYRAHPAELPIMLQDHSNPVRFRNIWVRELEPNN